jgi:hypothetical protein
LEEYPASVFFSNISSWRGDPVIKHGNNFAFTLPTTRLQDVITRKITIWIITAVKISNLIFEEKVKLSLSLFKHRVMKTDGGVQAWLHVFLFLFLISGIDRHEWSASLFGRFFPKKYPLYQMDVIYGQIGSVRLFTLSIVRNEYHHNLLHFIYSARNIKYIIYIKTRSLEFH